MSPENSQASARSPWGHVRWGRFAAIMVPSAVAAAVLIGLTSAGAVGASISVSGRAYEVTASQLRGSGFEQFGKVVTSRSADHPVALSAIRYAKITNLCQSVSVGGFTMLLRAGTGKTPVSADNLIVDADQLSGTATFHNIAIGQDASTLTEDPGTTGQAGAFGEQADSITIDNLRQHTWLTTAGTFTLPGLRLTVSHGGTC